MNVLILGAGKPAVEADSGSYPTLLTELGGVTLVERILTSVAALPARRLIVALREEDVARHHVDHVVRLVAPNAQVVRSKGVTSGAACTALLASQHFLADEELLIVSANEWLSCSYSESVEGLRSHGFDAGTLVFDSVHPRYSYVRVREGQVLEAAEKKPISRHATAGFYWFARTSDFLAGAHEMIRKDAHVNGLFYVCPVFNELILAQKKVGALPLNPSHYHPVKTEQQALREDTLLQGS